MTQMQRDGAPRRRVMDTSAGEAKRAVSEIVSSLRPRREKVTLIAARAERPLPVEERQKHLRECEEVAGVCQEARAALLERLLGAPRKVVTHSRVTDVEKALDNLEAATTAALKRLQVRS